MFLRKRNLARNTSICCQFFLLTKIIKRAQMLATHLWKRSNTVPFCDYYHLKREDFLIIYSLVKMVSWRFSIQIAIISLLINTPLIQGHPVWHLRKQHNPCTSSSRTFSAVLYNLLLLSLHLTFFQITGQIHHLIQAIRPNTGSLLVQLHLYKCNQHLFTNWLGQFQLWVPLSSREG